MGRGDNLFGINKLSLWVFKWKYLLGSQDTRWNSEAEGLAVVGRMMPILGMVGIHQFS